MPDLPLTKAGIETLPLPARNAVDYRDPKQRLLYLRVSPKGTKSWCLRYEMPPGKSHRINIGRFPELPISIAREKAADLLTSIARGNNPVRDKKLARETETRQALETVAAIGERYLEKAEEGRHRLNGKPFRPRSLKQEQDYFGVLKAKIGRDRLGDLTRARIQIVIDEIEKERSPSAARHARGVLCRMFSFAVWQDIVVNDPMKHVSAPTWKERERVLTDGELQALWTGIETVAALPEVDLAPTTGFCIKLAAVTLQRRGEVVGIHLDEIDEAARLWRIPGERTKNGRSHVVPLSDLALRLIRSAREARVGKARESEFLFPSPRDPGRSIDAMAMTHAWRRLIPNLTVPAPTAKNPDRRKKVEGIVPHDLRRTGATNLTGERLGIPRFIVSKVLNHTSDGGGAAGVTSVYDRNAYLVEKRRALDAWADLLLEIVEGRARDGNVVKIGAAR